MNYVNVDSSRKHLWVHASISINGEEDMERGLLWIENALSQKQIKRAIYAARSRSLQAGKELAAKLAQEVYTAKKSKIKNRLKATIVKNGEEASLYLSGFPGMNLAEFLPKPNRPDAPKPKAGVSVKVKRAGPRYVPKGKQANSSLPFIAPIYKKGGDYGIFVRYGKAKRRHMLFGPSPIQALYSWKRQDAISDRISSVFERRFIHELNVRLKGIVS